MAVLWLKLENAMDYNSKWSIISTGISNYPGNDKIICFLNDTKQQADCGLVDAGKAAIFFMQYFPQSSVIVQKEQTQVQTQVQAAVQENTNNVVEDIKEEIQTTDVKEEVQTSCVEENATESETTTENLGIESESNKTSSNDEDSTENELELEPKKTYIIKEDNTIEWIYEEKAGLEIFKEQWNEILENTKKTAKKTKTDEKDDKRFGVEFVVQQLIQMGNFISSFIEDIASREEQFEKNLGLPWKSAKQLSTFINGRMRALSKFGLMSLCGNANSFEEAKKMAPFSWIYEYYMKDDRADEEKIILDNKKKMEEAEKKKKEDAKKEKERKEKARKKAINDIAKKKALTKLESSEEYKALDEKAQKKKLTEVTKEFFSEAETEYNAQKAAEKEKVKTLSEKYETKNVNDVDEEKIKENNTLSAEETKSINPAGEPSGDGQISLFDVFGI